MRFLRSGADGNPPKGPGVYGCRLARMPRGHPGPPSSTLLLPPPTAPLQTSSDVPSSQLYKYKGADGSWVYTYQVADGRCVPLWPHMMSPTGQVVPLPSSLPFPLPTAPLPTSSQLPNRRAFVKQRGNVGAFYRSYYMAGESIFRDVFCEYDNGRTSFFGPSAQIQLWRATKGAGEKSEGVNKDVLEYVLGRAQELGHISTNVNLGKATSKSLRRLLKQHFHSVVFGKGF